MIKEHVNILTFRSIIIRAFTNIRGLYLLLFGSFLSTLTELFSMSLLSSLSDEGYIVFNAWLRYIGKEYVFLIIIILFIVRFTSLYFIEVRTYFIARMFHSSLASEVYGNILNQRLSKIQSRPIGEFINLVGDETSKVSEVLNAFLRLVSLLFVGLLYVLLLSYVDPIFMLVLLLFSILNFFVIRKSIKNLTIMGKQSSDFNRQSNSYVIDSLNSLRAIRSYGKSEVFSSNFGKIYKEFMLTNFNINRLSLFNKLFPLNSFYVFFALYIIGFIALGFQHDVVYLTTLFVIVLRLITIVADSLQTGSILVSNLTQTKDVMHFAKEAPDFRQGLKCEAIVKVELLNVCFNYQKGTNNVINKFNCEFHKGKSYAIVGPSGSGKSTLLDLIMNFQFPTFGKIKFNDFDSSTLDELDLSNKILYIGQETVILNDTIKNNLFIDEKLSEENFKMCADMVDLDSILNEFPDGLNHSLHYKGTNLSGGQKQRINILRALLKYPDVLIIDEGLSALDVFSRETIFNNIKKYYTNKLLIIVSHDTDLIDLVDEKIYLVNKPT